MTIDLKPYLDAVNEAQDHAAQIAEEINALMTDGKQKDALELRPLLDEAEQAVQDAQALYEAMKKTTAYSDAARKFVPVEGAAPDPELGDKQPEGVMTRADFEALDFAKRMEFALSGGQVVDDENGEK